MPDAIAAAGGADAVLRCGSPRTGPFETQLLAWHLHVHPREVGLTPRRAGHGRRAARLRARASAGLPHPGRLARWVVRASCGACLGPQRRGVPEPPREGRSSGDRAARRPSAPGRSSVRQAAAASSRPRRRDRGLAVGDPAVVRRQPLGHQHAQAGRARAPPRCASSSTRFWNTPPESTTVSSPRRARDLRARGGRRRGERRVEARGDDAGRHARRRRRRPRRRPSRARRARAVAAARRYAAAAGIGAAARPRSATRLELDRRLALVGDLACAARTARRPRRTAAPRSSSAARRGRRAASRATARPARRRRRARPAAAAAPVVLARAPRPATRTPSATARAPACSPPGIRTGRRWPARSKPARSADEQLAAPDRAVEPVARCRRRSRRPPGPPRRARPGRRPGARGGAGRRRARRPRARARTRSRGSPGAGRGRRPPARRANSRSKCAMPSRKERSVS